MTARVSALLTYGGATVTEPLTDLTLRDVARGAVKQTIVPLELPPDAKSAGMARRYVRDSLNALGRPELVECAVLGVDELVANVCTHARTTLLLTVSSVKDVVRIEVTDYSSALPVRQDAASYALGGRGLTLLDACGTWGLADPPAGEGKTIWFEPSASMEAGDA